MIGNTNNYKNNSYGYSDPTAYSLISKENEEEYERFHAVLNVLRDICSVADFEFGERIVLVDKKTGRIWR